MENIETMREDVKWLDILLDLQRKPVGIKFHLYDFDYDSAKSKESTVGTPYCTAVRNAALGKGCKMTAEHMACFSSARALGLMELDHDTVSGYRYSKLGVYKDLCVSRNVARERVYCKHKAYGVEIAPLSDYVNYDPDVVIIITNPYNAMRITQGYAFHNGSIKNVKFSGMQALCEECTTRPFENNEVNFSMLCSGTRCVAQWQKDELGIGIPFNKLPLIVDGLKNTFNHMDQNPEKRLIESKLKKYGIEDEVNIIYGKNYYTGNYGTLEMKKKKKQNEEK